MSGFITIYNTDEEPVDEQLIQSLTHTLKFRGPDRKRVWIDGNIGMGHTLFKTTFEAEYENQPSTLDNKVWITCSARIDDRENLVNKLGMKNKINLNKTPDSDLILYAYKKWGENCLDYLLGDFAFTIWDKTKQKIFCARDRFGMRQLYYAQKNNSIILCNTLGSILKHPYISKDLNERAIGGFLLFGNYKLMDKSITMFHDIMTLLPAHKLIMKNGKIAIQRYWDIPDNIPILQYKNKQDYVEHFREVFTHAVSDRIRTSSVAISMSGGMDSTSIAAIAKQLQNEHKIPTTQFNAITNVYDHTLSCKERYYSGIVADYLNIPIHYTVCDDYPFLLPSIKTTRPMELVQQTFMIDSEKKLSQFSRVELTGNSGDNLIRYPSTQQSLKESGIFNVIQDAINLQQLYGKHPPLGMGIKTKLKKLMSFGNQDIIANYPYPEWIQNDFEKKLDLKTEWKEMWNILQKKKSTHTRQSTLQYSLSEYDWNTDDILIESDFTLSEKRDPFLDLRMVELILALPALPWLFNKHVLRASMRGLLPDEVRYRPKTVLGYIENVLASKKENKWLSTWKPSIQSSPYIKETFSFSQTDTPLQHYLASRPITLDGWLKENIH